MRNLIMGYRRNLIVHYGVLGVLVIALFIIGYRTVAILTSAVQQTQSPENIAALMSVQQPRWRGAQAGSWPRSSSTVASNSGSKRQKVRLVAP